MIANVPYIETGDYYFFASPIVNERTIDLSEENDSADTTLSFFNVYEGLQQIISTEEIIDKEQNIYRQVNDIMRVHSFIKNSPSIFASSSEQYIITAFEKMRDGLIKLSLDTILTDISEEDECLFIYGTKNDIKLFFNLFFEKDNVETLVNISTSNGKYIIEDNIENSIQRLFEIFQAENSYEHLS